MFDKTSQISIVSVMIKLTYKEVAKLINRSGDYTRQLLAKDSVSMNNMEGVIDFICRHRTSKGECSIVDLSTVEGVNDFLADVRKIADNDAGISFRLPKNIRDLNSRELLL